MFNLLTKWFGGGFNARIVKQYLRIVDLINNYENKISKLSDEELSNKTVEFKQLLTSGKTMDDILPEAFAVVREAAKRVLGMRHFDVQLIGGIALHKGQIAEMKTGEGKTLVATCPVYLNALTNKGVHVVTVNDYLAKRDGQQMGQVYNFLGLTTSIIVSGMGDNQKREAYGADITYGTNHEFGFDYLRDNLKFSEEEMVMRPFNYAVVDEIDSILIDEARTPLIISGPDDSASQMYIAVDSVVKNITEEDYEKDPKTRNINLTEKGMIKVEKQLMDIGLINSPLYDPSNVSMVYYVNCALKANKLFKRDVDYIVRNGQVLIIDEFTGRVMDGRRYSEGLHQALEAKEGVEVQAESQTIASISYQNLFRMYPKLSGMTGTAMTEEAEFDEIYKLKVVSIPPNKPVIRKDQEDSIFLTMEEKDRAVLALIKECSVRKQPVLVGTTNLDRSEYISSLLTKAGIKHNVLNAKQHEREAYIISEAGAPGAVTIATNMAGRGTDIKLGGSVETRINLECAQIEDPIARENKIKQITAEVQRAHDEVVKLGGLFVIGTERNESRRIDNQLRGRSGRQGDPGASKYFLSLEDDLIKRFGSPNLARTLQKLGVKKDEDLTHRWISKAIEKAQQRVESYNFDIRKQLLKYDDVMNEQRKMIYAQRLKLMQSKDLSEYVSDMVFDTLDHICKLYISQEAVPFEWNLDELQKSIKDVFDIEIDKDQIANDSNMTYDLFRQQIQEQVDAKFNEVKSSIDPEYLKYYEKNLTLRTLDNAWKKHLITLEHLRRGINLQAYAQKNPLNEYKFEAFSIFEEMLNGVRKEIAAAMMHLKVSREPMFNGVEGSANIEELLRNLSELGESDDIEKLGKQSTEFLDIGSKSEQNLNESKLITSMIQNNASSIISRNSLCPCGSGKKYKECCGKLATVKFSNNTSNIVENEQNNINVLNESEQVHTSSSDGVSLTINVDNVANEEITHESEVNIEYRDPQEILEQFAKDQRDSVFDIDIGADSNNNISTNSNIEGKYNSNLNSNEEFGTLNINEIDTSINISKKKQKNEIQILNDNRDEIPPAKPKRGRPKGSKNKQKITDKETYSNDSEESVETKVKPRKRKSVVNKKIDIE